MNFSRLIIECIIYSVVLASIVTISQLFNARLWLNDYPKAIQEVAGERTKNEIKWKLIVGLPFIIIMFGYPILSTVLLKNTLGNSFNFWYGFFNMIIISTAFNIFDLIILDWLIFSYITPKYLVIEGTQGMKEYKDYFFHVKASLKGLIITIIFSTIITAILII